MKFMFLIVLAGLLSGGVYLAMAAEQTPQERRDAADDAVKKGNFKDAYNTYQALATSADDDAGKVSHDLSQAVQCLLRLGREDEVDDFREKVISLHGKNWRLLQTAAESYLTGNQNFGFMIAGKFYRGNHRGNDGKQVFTVDRDRVRALQLMQQALDLVEKEDNKTDRGNFYFALADMLLNSRYGGGAWQLQSLTDLSKLPDYEDGYPPYFYGGGTDRGAPVNADGSPVFYGIPKSWKESVNDGQRMRWCLIQAAEMSPEDASRAQFTFASFLQGQFDVQTMAQYGYFGRGRGGPESDDDTKKDESGPYAVGTLAEDETIARLASGVKRFKLPAEFNFIHIFQTLSDTGKGTYAELATNELGSIFENRQQYDRSAEYWNKSIQKFGDPKGIKKQQVEQILGNWANFDSLETEAAGKDASAWLLFRNGKHISLQAFELDVPKLLDDVKAYIKTKPNQLDGQKLQIDNIGWRLVQQNEQQYIIAKPAAEWEMDLTPREKHFDRRVKVAIPVKKAGAYLVIGKMKDGNTTRIVLWHADTAIVKKSLSNGAYYFVADAVTGQPIAKANVEYFGYQQRWIKDQTFQIDVQDFAENTDADGQVQLNNQLANNGYAWLAIATTADGRFAYYGFSGIWGGLYYDAQYNEQKVYCITDRPVYRPGNEMKFKFWIGQAQYDKEGASPFANKAFTVIVNNPKGEKVMEKTFTADEFGGFDGAMPLPADTTLGQYQCLVQTGPNQILGGGTFRVEEYKKPEFEVTVDAPTEPIMLGEKITATIKAKYYFGAPVVSAKVKYKVTRTSHSANWYPTGLWDWFYEPGYWWFSPDYNWYPGFEKWGCRRPIPSWYGNRYERPEIVAENEVPIGADGTVKVEIDTALAKAVHADTDHQYSISAEVTDDSRRTIVGQGNVLVARKPFKVYAWVDKGYYQTGDAIEADFQAQTLDNKPIKGTGLLKLLQVSYKDNKPVETEVQHWDLNTDDQGRARQQLKADKPGQYRLSYTVTDSKGHAIEGGYVFNIRGDAFDGRDFRFNDIELITDKKEYQAGDTVRLMINTERADSTVVLFLRPTNGIYLPPKVIRMKGKSAVEEVAVVMKDMPNFFIEALTVSNAKVRDEMREIVVPPASRVVNVELMPSQSEYKPGQKAKVKFKLTGTDGKPVEASAVISIYDKAVEYISGGSNVPEIKSFFWKWRRTHYPRSESSLDRASGAIGKNGEIQMGFLGVFGGMVADLDEQAKDLNAVDEGGTNFGVTARGAGPGGPMYGAMNGHGAGRGGAFPPGAFGRRGMTEKAAMATDGLADGQMDQLRAADKAGADRKRGEQESLQQDVGGQPMVEPTIRKNFADTAFWAAALKSGPDGTGEIELTMPESLTTWKARLWTMSSGTRVGEGSVEVVTHKDLIVRLQSPRFFTQTDEVVISANVHNYLKTAKSVKVSLDVAGNVLVPLLVSAPGNGLDQVVEIPAGGEKRVDWRMQVIQPGTAVLRASARTDEESDAMEMSFPAFVHGMLKTESFSGALRPQDQGSSLTFNIPKERLPDQSRIEVRYSPSVASAMVDALPYLVDYPYGCTEQTLNRFLPTVITQKVLIGMNLDLKDIEKKRTNLNAQEIGDDPKRAADWKRNNPPNPDVKERNPVFDVATVTAMSKEGVNKLTNMQNSDGGWGWFSGFGEQSFPHTTAVVVHGLQIAKENDVALVPGVFDRGVEWLKRYQAQQVQWIKNAPTKTQPWKEHADDLDALVYMVLNDAKAQTGDMKDMNEFLYRDRTFIGVYAKAMYGLALFANKEQQKLGMILQNISQFVVEDNENQTAYLKLPEGNSWWNWYGSDTEAMAYYLKLLSRTDAKGAVASKMSKYLINNRKHASYWNSTRDTALVIDALADFIKASGESKPDMTVVLTLDGKKMKEVKITADNFFSFDNKLVLAGADVTTGAHKLEVTRIGTGPLYFNAYVTNFTLENPIKKAGLEIKVERAFYKLVEVDMKIKAEGSLGQVLSQKVEKYERQPLSDGAILKSGDLVEVEMEIDSKNDYEYILFEDMKAAGFEPVEVRSGYNGNDLNAYMELHDERVCFFARTLARGKHSVSYRLRAEIPGKFSALPTKASAMYAPELKANSDENKVQIVD